MTTRPSKVRIGPFTWTVSYDDAELQALDDDRQQARFGVSIPRSFHIIVASSNRPESAVQETLVHELLHAIDHTNGHQHSAAKDDGDRAEENILFLSPWLFTVLQGNRDLIAYLAADFA